MVGRTFTSLILIEKISMQQRIEHFLERSMYASRWIMAPIYLGMSVILLALAIKFFQELYSLFSADIRFA